MTIPSHASAVVIGGGIMGCSTLYHLARLGVRDAVLLEKHKLTSGTTWHSAAQVRQLRSTRNLTRLIQYSSKLYAELEAETGQSTGWIRTGSLSIATNPDRLVHIRRQAALAKAYGLEAEEIGVDEVKRLWPLINDKDIVGAVWSPDDGRVNPSDLCLALTKGAKVNGAAVFEDIAVTDFIVDKGRIAGVTTAQGVIRCEKVALCAGLWSRDLALKGGIHVPLLPCEHYYLLTRPIDAIDGHLPTLSDHDAHLYIRDDVGGLLVGCFEPEAKAILPEDLGAHFAFSLLPEDWDHFEPMMRNALHRIPALETAEVRTLLNGPESFTPDGAFLLGAKAELPGLFLGCGMNSVGVATGGGAGWALAQWMADGGAPFHLGEADPNRFHVSENTTSVLVSRAPEVLGKHYEIAFPGRQWASARGLRLLPAHERWATARARFGQLFGWERPLYFGSGDEPSLTFQRPPWFEYVEREVAAAHERAALFDQSTFGKIRVQGQDAERFLNRVCANDMTRPPDRAIYTAMLNEMGGYESDLTALRIAETEYWLYTGTGAISRDLAWLQRHLQDDEDVAISDITEDYAVFGLMGPRSAAVAEALGANWLNDIHYFHHATGQVAGVDVRATRLSYVGEAGWEITCQTADADRLCAAMLNRGVTPAGLYAQTSMRIEKCFLAIGHDLDGDISPLEAGLEFAVRSEKDFVGRQVYLRRCESGPAARLVSIVLEDSQAVPLGDEPVYDNTGRCIGQATSAAYGYRVQRPVALAYIETASIPQTGSVTVELDIAGARAAGAASPRAAFDPAGTRMRVVR